MIHEKELLELAGFRGQLAPVLSLYLNVDPRRRTVDQYRLALRHQLGSVSEVADQADAEAIGRYFEFEYNWQGRGVACFSCRRDDWWRVYPLWVPVEDAILVARRPYVRPLIDISGVYARHLVALVSKSEARFFLFEQGQAHEMESVSGEEVKRHRQGGWAAARYQRHEDAAAYRNIKDIVVATGNHAERLDCQRLILAGTDQTVSQFHSLLPKALQVQVVGSFPLDMNATASDVAERSLEVARQAEHARSIALVRSTITTASKGGAAALGLADTLRLLEEGRVHHVLLADDFHGSAHQCQKCGYMTGESMEHCAFCAGEMRELRDAVNALVSRSLQRGVEVTTVREQTELQALGSVAAILRY